MGQLTNAFTPAKQPTMSSREIAQDLVKDHDDVMSDIRRMLDDGKFPPSERPVADGKVKPKEDVVWCRFSIHWAARAGRSKSYESTYLDLDSGDMRVEMQLPKEETICLWTLYDHPFSARIIERFGLSPAAIQLRAAPPRPARGGAGDKVYFIGSSDGSIKIGFARNPKTRLAALQTGHPDRLSLLAVTTGGAAVEGQYHKKFSAHRRSGEWFDRHPDILAEIDRLNAISGGVSA